MVVVKITYFVHGTTIDNEKNISSGWKDAKLSKLGIKQSKELTKQIGNKKFDIVFCSDLTRAVDSANIIFKNKFPIKCDKRLRECNYGAYNGESSDIVEPMQERYITRAFPKGESYENVKERVKDFLEDLAKNYQGKNVAIVSHKAPQLALEVILKGKTWKQAFADDWRKKKAWRPGWKYILYKERPMSKDAPMYMFATERVGEYYSALNVKDKKVLTVCGSGDQIIEALFLGAKDITGYDLNYNSFHILNLKIAVIKKCTYKEFLNFFSNKKTKGSLDFSIYSKIRKNLVKETSAFFDGLYGRFENNGSKLIRSDFFRRRDDLPGFGPKIINYYLNNENNYFKTKQLLSNWMPRFLQSDVKDLYQKLKSEKESFDIINLSNIPNYYLRYLQKTYKIDEKESLNKFYRNLIIPLGKLLSPKGEIFFYSYSNTIYPNRITSKCPFVSTKEALRIMKSRKEFKIKQIEFEGIGPGTKDRISIFQKV